MDSNISTEELQRRVNARQAYIKKIIDFVEKITRKRGKVIKYDQGSSHTNIERKLSGFNNFTFLADTGHCMFGGNSFDVWYHPKSVDIDTEKVKPVLSVYYQTNADECKVEIFDESTAWQKALGYTMAHEEEIIAREEKTIAQLKKEGEICAEESRIRDQLLADAKRLKLL